MPGDTVDTLIVPGCGQPQNFIFTRELCEVYLLLDHISGRPDKNMPEDSIADICKIGWPPSGTATERAEQAKILLIAKNRLNGAATPATGATIAFSLLVTGGDDDGTGPSAQQGPIAATAGTVWAQTPSRISLARTAFPGLVGSAARFRKSIRVIILAMLLWLAFTCLLSWNVAAGHAILARLDALAKAQTDIFAKINAADLEEDRGAAGTQFSAEIGPYCERHRKAEGGHAERFNTASALRVCEPLDRNNLAHRVAYANLADWVTVWGFVKWVPRLICGGPCLAASGDEQALTQNATDEQWASILNEVLGGAVLPVCYGILGAAAAIVRDLWRKVRESLLSPRDLTLALGQLALGAVIGACIGLFVTPSGGGDPAAPSFTGAVTLSASALSFIAGFGVEGVFVALESFIARVFNMKADVQPEVSPPRNRPASST